MTSDQLPTTIAPARASRMLTAAEFHQLADVPPEVEWFANLTNAHTPPSLRNRRQGLHAFHRHRPAGGISYRHARAHHRLARGSADTPTKRGERGGSIDPAPAFRRWRHCSNISAIRTPSPTIRSKGSTAEIGERRRQDAGDRRSSGSQAARGPAGRHDPAASVTAPFCPRCSFTRCAARNCASSRSRISATFAKASRTSKCRAKAARRVICLCIRAPSNATTSRWLSLGS